MPAWTDGTYNKTEVWLQYNWILMKNTAFLSAIYFFLVRDGME